MGVDRPGCFLYDDVRQRGSALCLGPLLGYAVSRMGVALGWPDWAHRDPVADVFRVIDPVAVQPPA